MHYFALLAQAAPDVEPGMAGLLDRLSGRDLQSLLTVLIGCGLALAVVVVVQWRMLKQAEIEATLKQDMIAQGMSAEEIERILNAGVGNASRRNKRKCHTSGVQH